jgi:hypothetical protein
MAPCSGTERTRMLVHVCQTPQCSELPGVQHCSSLPSSTARFASFVRCLLAPGPCKALTLMPDSLQPVRSPTCQLVPAGRPRLRGSHCRRPARRPWQSQAQAHHWQRRWKDYRQTLTWPHTCLGRWVGWWSQFCGKGSLLQERAQMNLDGQLREKQIGQSKVCASSHHAQQH